MDSQDLQVLAAVRRWRAEGHRAALVTVAQTWGSAPRPAGAWMALRDDGRVQGSVSGGCIEDDMIARMLDGRIGGSQPFVLTYGVTREEANRFGLPCGGTLELVVEPAPDHALLTDLAARLEGGQLVRREIELASGKVRILDACRGEALQWDGQRLSTIHGPHWRLLIIGANQTARALAQIAIMLEFQVIICDPREEFTADWDISGVRLQAGMPDDAVGAIQTDSRTAIVAITHDPKLDDMALLEALISPAFYVGALGSVRNQSKRRERLLSFDLTEKDLDRLHGPVGLAIGSRTPAEIAVAIAAELVQVRRKFEDLRVGGLDQPPGGGVPNS